MDTATYFTAWGQAYLLLLIQLGGLGILTFTTLVILALGRRVSLHHEALNAPPSGVTWDMDFRHLARNIVVFTFAFEAVGALMLFLLWHGRLGAVGAAWHAVFHAVSAFCNAGFSTFSTSLVAFHDDPAVLGVIITLIVIGGMGFLTLAELDAMRRRPGASRAGTFSLHTQLVLATTGFLLIGGWVVFTALEWTNTLAGMPVSAKLINGLFMSVTARTAGFNTVDYASTADSTNFFTILLMSVGGSPGSTAGGIKTTTVALIALLAVSRVLGRQVTSIRHRSVPDATIQRAVGLSVVAFATVTVAILLYSVLEIGATGHQRAGGEFVRYMFEAVSAFNTVGLSMGVTPDLSSASRLLTVFLMYMGRVGPLSFAAAIALRQAKAAGEFRYAYEDVIIG